MIMLLDLANWCCQPTSKWRSRRKGVDENCTTKFTPVKYTQIDQIEWRRHCHTSKHVKTKKHISGVLGTGQYLKHNLIGSDLQVQGGMISNRFGSSYARFVNPTAAMHMSSIVLYLWNVWHTHTHRGMASLLDQHKPHWNNGLAMFAICEYGFWQVNNWFLKLLAWPLGWSQSQFGHCSPFLEIQTFHSHNHAQECGRLGNTRSWEKYLTPGFPCTKVPPSPVQIGGTATVLPGSEVSKFSLLASSAPTVEAPVDAPGVWASSGSLAVRPRGNIWNKNENNLKSNMFKKTCLKKQWRKMFT